MFIEKLELKDIKDFYSKNYGLDLDLQRDKKNIRANIVYKSSKLSPQFVFSDFNCEAVNASANLNQNAMFNMWKMFMLNKFGEKYRTEFIARMDREKI